jgi:adenylyltransferase/sulfurtransferase
VLKVKRDPQCPVCGDHPTQTRLIDYEAFCGLAAAPSADAASNGHAEAGPAAGR